MSIQDVFLCEFGLQGGKFYQIWLCRVKGLALFWPFSIESLSFFINFVGRFWPFLTEGLAFSEKRSLATLFYSFVTMDGNPAFTVHAIGHAFRAAININSMLLRQQMLRKLFDL